MPGAGQHKFSFMVSFGKEEGKCGEAMQKTRKSLISNILWALVIGIQILVLKNWGEGVCFEQYVKQKQLTNSKSIGQVVCNHKY